MKIRPFLVSLGLVILAPLVRADAPAEEPIKDRKSFFPSRKQVAVKGTVIGILLTDGQAVLSLEGRSGPADQLVFSSGGNSYRWVYVPTLDNPLITNLQVPVGPKGETQIFPALNMANPRSVIPWGITQGYTLVEVTVNGGLGSPANDSFVATSMKVLEGTKDYPLKTARLIKDVQKRYAEHQTKQAAEIEERMAAAGKKALGDKKATGPREKSDLMYVTWLPDNDRLLVRFMTKLSDGAFSVVKGGFGGQPIGDPIPLPPNKRPIRKLPPQPEVDGGAIQLLRAAPPRPINIKVGTAFGVEYGMAYEINKDGEVVRSQPLEFQAFQQNLNAPQLPGGPGGRPLPRLQPQPVDSAPKE